MHSLLRNTDLAASRTLHALWQTAHTVLVSSHLSYWRWRLHNRRWRNIYVDLLTLPSRIVVPLHSPVTNRGTASLSRHESWYLFTLPSRIVPETVVFAARTYGNLTASESKFYYLLHIILSVYSWLSRWKQHESHHITDLMYVDVITIVYFWRF